MGGVRELQEKKKSYVPSDILKAVKVILIKFVSKKIYFKSTTEKI